MRCRAAMFTRCSVADSAENPTKGSHGQVQPIGSLRTVPPTAHWRLLMSRRLLSASLIAFFATTTTLAVGGSASASVPAKAPAQASVAAKPSPPPPDNNANPNNGPGGFKRHGTQNCPHPLKYPPLPCSLLLSKTQGPPGTAVNIVGPGYTPNCHVSIYFDAPFLRQL